MKLKFLLCFAAFAAWSFGASAQTCTTAPSCSELGFTKNVAACDGKTILYCPFDKTKVYCSDNTNFDCANNGYSETAASCSGDYIPCPADKSKVRCLTPCPASSIVSNCSSENYYYNKDSGLCQKSKTDIVYIGNGKIAMAFSPSSLDDLDDIIRICLKNDMRLADLIETATYMTILDVSSIDEFHVLTLGSPTCFTLGIGGYTEKERCSNFYKAVCVKDLL